MLKETTGIKLRICESDIRLKPEPAAARIKSTVTVVHETDGGTPYEGSYTVTPKTMSEVTLETKSKTMKDNVTVLKTPQYEVSNEAGGTTLIMGDEYYGK